MGIFCATSCCLLWISFYWLVPAGGWGRGEGLHARLFFYLMGIYSISHAVPLFGTVIHCTTGMGGPGGDPQVDARLFLRYITSLY